jgi:electron transport complex protein RnfD
MATSQLMMKVQLALLPGIFALTYFFGIGIIVNVAFTMLLCLALELMVLKLRDMPLSISRDHSALCTGALLGLALPPNLPFGIILIACIFAIIFAKHMYGGLGQNIFNPAMVGFAVLIISFPLAMSDWPAPEFVIYSFIDAVAVKAGITPIDAFTGATPLDQFKFRGALTVDEFWQEFGTQTWNAWLTINIAFLAGGLYLLNNRVCSWRAPLSMLLTLFVLSIAFFDGGSSSSLGSPLFHLFSGATMMAAFFIATDPVTSPDSNRGQVIFGVGVGLLTFVIRSIGAYPEGIAFAILLMNAASPLLDYIEYRIEYRVNKPVKKILLTDSSTEDSSAEDSA